MVSFLLLPLHHAFHGRTKPVPEVEGGTGPGLRCLRHWSLTREGVGERGLRALAPARSREFGPDIVWRMYDKLCQCYGVVGSSPSCMMKPRTRTEPPNPAVIVYVLITRTVYRILITASFVAAP
jgi:hypothetical protein